MVCQSCLQGKNRKGADHEQNLSSENVNNDEAEKEETNEQFDPEKENECRETAGELFKLCFPLQNVFFLA